MRLSTATFDSNKGSVTNEIYFDTIVSSLEMASVTFSIDISPLVIGKRAQVLYKPADSTATLSVHDSTFNCQNVNLDEDEVIFKYDLE